MIKIITLGDFDIRLNDKSIVEKLGHSPKIIKLFKYFLVHKDVKLLPETIIEDLWVDEDSKNPISMIRTQISRLRNILTSNNISEESFFSIDYINGYYVFTLEEESKVDFIEFENVLKKDYISLKEYINKNPEKIKDIILSYKGEFLGEVGDEDWLLPIRSRYDRLYVKALSSYIDYLKENNMHSEIINFCEKAINIKPYEELIHISFMEALVELKQNSYALIHYEFFTKKLYNDLKITPSKELKEVYKKIQSKEEEDSSSNIDLNKIDKEMVKEFDFGGIIYCDIDYFRFLYNYERRNRDRRVDKSIGTGIGIITIYNKGYEQLTEKEIKKGMDQLGYLLFKILRSGDIVSKWNNNQMIMMLYGLREEHIGNVVDKIKNGFDEIKLDEKLSLSIKLDVL